MTFGLITTAMALSTLPQRWNTSATRANRTSRTGSATCSNLAGTCDAAETGAKQYTLGYVYDLSKRSNLYLHWTRFRNERLASYTWGVAPVLGAGAGSDPQALALGLRHAF